MKKLIPVILTMSLMSGVAVICLCNLSKDAEQLKADNITTEYLILDAENCKDAAQNYTNMYISCEQTGPSKQCHIWIDSAQKYLDLAIYLNQKADSVNKAAKVLHDKINMMRY